MSKRKKQINIMGQPDLKMLVPKEIFAFLIEGKITHLLTWKEFDAEKEKQPKLIEVASEAEPDDGILVRCISIDRQGFGYVPPGYPESFKATGKTSRLTVELIGGDIAAETEASPETGDTKE